MKAFLTVLKNPHFRSLWLGQITSQIALNMLYFVLAIRVYSETHSNTSVSLMLLSFGIPAIFFGIIAGVIVDYFDKKDILFFSNIARVILLLLFFFFEKNLYLLYFLSIITSIITQLFIPAEAPSIPLLVKRDQILTANSLFTISYYLSTVLGFILAGPMIRLFGHKDIFLVMMGIMATASYFIYRLPKLRATSEVGRFEFKKVFSGKIILDGLEFIKSNERIRESLMLMTFAQVLISTLSTLAPGFADRVLTIELSDASLLVMGPAAAGLVAGALWVGAYGKKILKGRIILTGMIGSGIMLVLLSMLSKSGLLLANAQLFALGVFNSLISVPANTILQQDSDEEVRGRVYGALTSLTGGVSLLPVVFSGIMADVIGVGSTMLIIGILVEVVSIYEYYRRIGANRQIT